MSILLFISLASMSAVIPNGKSAEPCSVVRSKISTVPEGDSRWDPENNGMDNANDKLAERIRNCFDSCASEYHVNLENCKLFPKNMEGECLASSILEFSRCKSKCEKLR